MATTEYFYGTGRRKSSVARVYLRRGQGNITVNGNAIGDYFGRPTHHQLIQQPMDSAGLEKNFDVRAEVRGGGLSGQCDAIKLGIARALINYDEELRPKLRAGGFLTRDPRVVERKKVGLRKARKSPQFSKR